MLVYNGSHNFKPEPQDLSSKIDQSAMKLHSKPQMTRRQLIRNRTCALIMLVAINALTYWAIKTLLSGS